LAYFEGALKGSAMIETLRKELASVAEDLSKEI
jgi:hypothetical protein